MAQGTSDFDTWLDGVEKSARRLDLVSALESVAQTAYDAFGVRLWFVEILGRRWSYVAGKRNEEPTQRETCRIPLHDKIGLVCDGWGTLSEAERDRLIAFLTRLASSKKTGSCRTTDE